MLPKMGRKLPPWNGALAGHEAYALAIAKLLRREHGDSHRAIKQLMRQSGASERAVKNWLSSDHGPGSLYLLRLAVNSPSIRAFILRLFEDPAAQPYSDPIGGPTLSEIRNANALGQALDGSRTMREWRIGGKNVPNNVPNNVPRNVLKNDLANVRDLPELSERQYWFLEQLLEGSLLGAKEISSVWRVSLKTARRDIGGLQKAKLVEYVGSSRRGIYKLLLM
jgi:hypothetical protein